MTLDSEDIERIAHRVAELLREPEASDRREVLADAAEVARRFDVDRSWVYANASALGAIPLGNGPRPRLRFHLDAVAERLGTRPVPDQPRPRKPSRRRPVAETELLPVKGMKP